MCSAPTTKTAIINVFDNITLQQNTAPTSIQVTNGTYNFNLLVCSAPAAISISAIDLSNQQTSLPMGYVLNNGNNTIPNVQACGIVPDEYVYYTINGTPYYRSTGNAYFLHSFYAPPVIPNPTDAFSVYSNATLTVPHSSFSIDRPGSFPINSASLLNMGMYGVIPSGTPYPNPITVCYTEFGNIGQYIAGSFSGTIKNTVDNVIYNITCSFRMKRKL